jgi:hypothetical protein
MFWSTSTGIYEEINQNVLVVGDYKAFNKDRGDSSPEIVDVRVSSLHCSTRKHRTGWQSASASYISDQGSIPSPPSVP